jgi:hypothetical protein
MLARPNDAAPAWRGVVVLWAGAKTSPMVEPTKNELLAAEPGSIDTDALTFGGPRGNARLHLERAALEAALAALPPAPLDDGTLELMVARGRRGERNLPAEVVLTPDGGMPGDRWVKDGRYGPEYQLATIRADFAKVVANGQRLDLHGDNLYVHLDLSSQNLPTHSRVRLGEALLEVTPQAHNGCKKWVQRFGLAPMQLNLDPAYRAIHLRGIYFRVIEEGRVRLGDRAVVVSRGR